MIPKSLLPHTAIIQLKAGNTAYGSGGYGAEVKVRGRFDGRRRMVKRSNGQDSLTSGTFICRPDVEVDLGSRVHINDRDYEVIEIIPRPGPYKDHHKELMLT